MPARKSFVVLQDVIVVLFLIKNIVLLLKEICEIRQSDILLLDNTASPLDNKVEGLSHYFLATAFSSLCLAHVENSALWWSYSNRFLLYKCREV